MKNKRFPTAGFTLVEIMIAIAIIGLLAGISIPNFLKARSVAQADTCISHLREIDTATQEWALENKKNEHQAVIYADILPYLKGNMTCPTGGSSFLDSYNLTVVSEKPTCRKVTTGDRPHVLPADCR
jgi:prepilin-type N-terminal cleavage/methylation domain-containing protein